MVKYAYMLHVYVIHAYVFRKHQKFGRWSMSQKHQKYTQPLYFQFFLTASKIAWIKRVEVLNTYLWWLQKDLKWQAAALGGGGGSDWGLRKDFSPESGQALKWALHHSGHSTELLELKNIE